MDIFELTVPQLIRTLRNLDRWITRAGDLPVEKVFAARLAPDQHVFSRQVQIATDNAKFMAGRLADKPWPSHPDTEATFDQMRARIASVTSYLETFQPSDFIEARERKIVLPWMESGSYLRGGDYLIQFALPNYYFHITTAYAILRHLGVQLGKSDYLGQIELQA